MQTLSSNFVGKAEQTTKKKSQEVQKVHRLELNRTPPKYSSTGFQLQKSVQ